MPYFDATRGDKIYDLDKLEGELSFDPVAETEKGK
jgi:hypothetical protein